MNAPSERTRVKRMNKRAAYDAETVHGILDAMPVCNVGYVFDGAPYVTPTLQWREGRHVYWHGSSASRMLEACAEAEVCLTVSIVDGFVMARSAFNHSCNYRSVMVFGTARKLTDAAEKEMRLRTFTDGLWPGRWDMLRQMTAQELKATTVLKLSLAEASAKVRTGASGDDEADYALPIWAGVIPVRMEVLAPVDDPRLIAGLAPPQHITDFKIG
ncbi:pyridoxamine 5'-phosphate oxidase family protein [Aestuariivirga sp.]|uniref:pyridoxamine 5'-phosphate oxidase family protein n=1 Tax=Aestuariivirga sp. TaxID=2650926 RepID=UPI0025C38566|nr:pyridoxamine 5'-phosphate oxidase family protein [Aestuariivirga sp.]MCA3555259.1 pyridoxamine 5'-phosphate oxidase family protein [Aestuariivirga sp.]